MLMSAKAGVDVVQRDRYSVVAIAFHWAIAACIAIQLFLGWRMGDIEGLGRSTLVRLHESVGIGVLVLTAGRLLWRWGNPPPPPHSSLTPFEHKVSHWVHMGFYFALFALPLTGWAMVSMEQAGGLQLFGAIPWPSFPLLNLLPNAAQDTLADGSDTVHGWLVYLMLALLALHVAGALKHHFISRDPTIPRMVPGSKPGQFDSRLTAIVATIAVVAGAVYLSPLPKAVPRPKPTNLAKADIYLDVVDNMMQRRCSNCHSDDQSRGGLSVSSYDSIMRGGREGPVVVPGNPAKSDLYHRVIVPNTDPNYMPKGDRPPLTADQISALALWIQIGAPRSGAIGSLHLKDDQLALLSHVLNLDADNANTGPVGFDENANLPKVDRADPAIIRTMEQQGFILRPVDKDSNLLDVDFTVKRDLNDGDMANLTKVAPQILRLNLHRSGLTDAELKTVAAFPNIRRLRLDYTAITDAGMQPIYGMKNLANLSLTNTKVTDAGVAGLGQVKNLHFLYLWGTGVTQPALSQQLAELRRSDLVKTRRESKQVYYRLANDKVLLCVEAIEAMFSDDAAATLKRRLQIAKPAKKTETGAALFAQIDQK